MKASTHPKYETIAVTCSCGHTFETCSTLARDLTIEVCSNCHPFYTGKQKLIDTGGRVQRFRDRYNKSREQKPTPENVDNKETSSVKNASSKKTVKVSKSPKDGKEAKPKKASKTKE